MKGNAYTALARVYKTLTGSDYAESRAYLIRELKSRGAGIKGLDLGCGGGETLLALVNAGYRMTGVDISSEMLQNASALLQGKNVPLYEQDMAKLRLPEIYDFAYSLTDGFNYIPKSSALKTLRGVNKALKKGGLLFLDLSSEYKLQTVLGDNLFGEDGEDLSYLWFNRKTESGVEMDLSFFFRLPNGTYEKKEERHVQYAYGLEELQALLGESGFTLLGAYGEAGAPYEAQSHRLCVWAEKTGK